MCGVTTNFCGTHKTKKNQRVKKSLLLFLVCLQSPPSPPPPTTPLIIITLLHRISYTYMQSFLEMVRLFVVRRVLVITNGRDRDLKIFKMLLLPTPLVLLFNVYVLVNGLLEAV